MVFKLSWKNISSYIPVSIESINCKRPRGLRLLSIKILHELYIAFYAIAGVVKNQVIKMYALN